MRKFWTNEVPINRNCKSAEPSTKRVEPKGSPKKAVSPAEAPLNVNILLGSSELKQYSLNS